MLTRCRCARDILVTLFIYGPIYVIEAQLGWIAGGLLSLVSALLLVSPLIRKSADRLARVR